MASKFAEIFCGEVVKDLSAKGKLPGIEKKVARTGAGTTTLVGKEDGGAQTVRTESGRVIVNSKTFLLDAPIFFTTLLLL